MKPTIYEIFNARVLVHFISKKLRRKHNEKIHDAGYVQRSDKAVELYQKAFNAKIIDTYPGDDGTYYHAELDIVYC